MNFKEALIAHLQGEKVEVMGIDGVWKPFMLIVGDARLVHVDAPSFCAGCSFRLAPRTILVNGVEVPAPESVEPNKGDYYWLVDFCDCTDDELCSEQRWDGYPQDNAWFERGLVYLDKESAIARAKAMLIVQSK